MTILDFFDERRPVEKVLACGTGYRRQHYHGPQMPNDDSELKMPANSVVLSGK